MFGRDHQRLRSKEVAACDPFSLNKDSERDALIRGTSHQTTQLVLHFPMMFEGNLSAEISCISQQNR